MLRFRSNLFIVLTIASMGCDRALAQNADIIPLVEIPAEVTIWVVMVRVRTLMRLPFIR